MVTELFDVNRLLTIPLQQAREYLDQPVEIPADPVVYDQRRTQHEVRSGMPSFFAKLAEQLRQAQDVSTAQAATFAERVTAPQPYYDEDAGGFAPFDTGVVDEIQRTLRARGLAVSATPAASSLSSKAASKVARGAAKAAEKDDDGGGGGLLSGIKRAVSAVVPDKVERVAKTALNLDDKVASRIEDLASAVTPDAIERRIPPPVKYAGGMAADAAGEVATLPIQPLEAALKAPEKFLDTFRAVMRMDHEVGLALARKLPQTSWDWNMPGFHDVNIEGIFAEVLRPSNFIPVGGPGKGTMKEVAWWLAKEGMANAAIVAADAANQGADAMGVLKAAAFGFGAGTVLPGSVHLAGRALGKFAPDATSGKMTGEEMAKAIAEDAERAVNDPKTYTDENGITWVETGEVTTTGERGAIPQPAGAAAADAADEAAMPEAERAGMREYTPEEVTRPSTADLSKLSDEEFEAAHATAVERVNNLEDRLTDKAGDNLRAPKGEEALKLAEEDLERFDAEASRRAESEAERAGMREYTPESVRTPVEEPGAPPAKNTMSASEAEYFQKQTREQTEAWNDLVRRAEEGDKEAENEVIRRVNEGRVLETPNDLKKYGQRFPQDRFSPGESRVVAPEQQQRLDAIRSEEAAYREKFTALSPDEQERLRAMGFAPDRSTEAAVSPEGKQLTPTSVEGNRAVYDAGKYELTAAKQPDGSVELSFRNKDADWTTGDEGLPGSVTDVAEVGRVIDSYAAENPATEIWATPKDERTSRIYERFGFDKSEDGTRLILDRERFGETLSRFTSAPKDAAAIRVASKEASVAATAATALTPDSSVSDLRAFIKANAATLGDARDYVGPDSRYWHRPEGGGVAKLDIPSIVADIRAKVRAADTAATDPRFRRPFSDILNRTKDDLLGGCAK